LSLFSSYFYTVKPQKYMIVANKVQKLSPVANKKLKKNQCLISNLDFFSDW
jgi:hypothetical protein